jgi:hypothetical protein
MNEINRKFYPLAFAFSSHEQNEDFRKFFINLTKITMKLNITLAPQFMCIDASKAMAFAINKVFSPLYRINVLVSYKI